MGSKICQRKRNSAGEERKSSHWGRRCGCCCGPVLLCVHDGSLPCKVGGSCFREFWFGILEVRLKRCSFRLLVLCIPGSQVSFYFSLKLRSSEIDLAKTKHVRMMMCQTKHVSMMMCQLTTKTNRRGWIANRTKLQM